MLYGASGNFADRGEDGYIGDIFLNDFKLHYGSLDDTGIIIATLFETI